jgi:putative membrane protein
VLMARLLMARLLMGVVIVAYVWSGIAPRRLDTWFFETVWIPMGLAVILFSWRRFPLTTLLCAVLALHALVLAYGGHYTYAQTPLGEWMRAELHLQRNPYDRLAHFMQGFAPAIAVREVLWRASPLRGSRWLPALTVMCALAISAAWELLEWAGAYATAGGDPAFLGAQGDPWDTQWDMFMATIGALVALVALSRWHDRQLSALSAVANR